MGGGGPVCGRGSKHDEKRKNNGEEGDIRGIHYKAVLALMELTGLKHGGTI